MTEQAYADCLGQPSLNTNEALRRRAEKTAAKYRNRISEAKAVISDEISSESKVQFE